MWKYRYLSLVVTFAFFLSSCYQESDDTPVNILDDPSISIFTFEGHTATLAPDGIYDVEVTFSSVYNQLSDEQKARIEGIRVYRNGGVQQPIPPEATSFTDRTVFTLCYELAFLTDGNEISELSEEYCVNL